jgi:hypothetical protein
MKCLNHLEVDAIGACVRCGKGLCIDCKREIAGRILCQGCADEILTQKTTPTIVMSREEAPGALLALILSIVGFVFSPLAIVLGPMAVHYANQAKAALKQRPEINGRSLATAGFIIGIIDIVIGVFFILYIIFIIVLFVCVEPSTTSH